MSEKKINLSRRKVLGGLVTLGAAGAASGAGTFALFSDQESSTNNTVQSGTLNLSGDEVSSFNVSSTGLAPGESVGPNTLTIINDGSLAADHLEIDVSASQSDGDTGDPNSSGRNVGVMEYALNLDVPTLKYGGSSVDNEDLPGAFIEDATSVNGDGSRSKPSDDTNVVNVTSHGKSVSDYAYAAVDVDETVSDLSDGAFEYKWYSKNDGTKADYVAMPDEYYLVLDDGTKLWKRASNPTAGKWVTKDLTGEVAGGKTWNGWYYNRDHTLSSDDVVAEFGVGLGDWVDVNTGNSTPNRREFDVQLSAVNVLGSKKKFPTDSTPNLQDLRTTGSNVSLPDLNAPGNGTDFKIKLTLNENVGNAFQGDGVNMTFDFGLAQQSGQDVL